MDLKYVDERIRPRIVWYDARAVACKRIHIALQYFTAAASITLVVLIDVEAVSRLTLALIAAAVAFATMVERIGQFGDKWHLYRSAYEGLESEVRLFRHNAGPYRGTEDERLLVERTESLLAVERTQWLSVLKRSVEPDRESRLPLP